MTYHVCIDAPIGRYNFLEVSLEEAKAVAAAYLNQEREFEFRGEVHDLRELNSFRIVGWDERKKFSKFLQTARDTGRIVETELGEWMSPELLLGVGKDMTSIILDGLDAAREDLLAAAGGGVQSSLQMDATPEASVAPESTDSSSSGGGYKYEIYICHSRDDIALTADVVTLIRSAFNFHSDQIRCTSLPGFTLPADMTNDKKIQIQCRESRFWIGLVTPLALQQGFVMFEGGGRWGWNYGDMTLVTFNADIIDQSDGPIAKVRLLNGNTTDGLTKLIKKIQTSTGIVPESPSVYQRDMNNVIKQGEKSRDALRAIVALD